MYFGERFQEVEVGKEPGRQGELKMEKVGGLPEVRVEVGQSTGCQILYMQVDSCGKDKNSPWRDILSSNNRNTHWSIRKLNN
eukprot:13637652-Ditylum_brightwellii.AAC.1